MGQSHDPKQIDGFRGIAERLSDALSEQRFEEALKRLMAPSRSRKVIPPSDDETTPRPK